jgi:hypothetical protein
MMSTDLSGVIACRSVTTNRLEATPQEFPPYKAWPAIEQWNRYYTLPTIGISYSPGNPSYEFLEEQIIRSYPQLERYRFLLIPWIEKNCVSLHGHQYNAQIFLDACTTLIYKLLFFDPYSPWDDNYDEEEDLKSRTYPENFRELINAVIPGINPDHGFSMTHETGHLVSFSLERPAITEFQNTWSRIEALLQQAATGSCDVFWNKFVKLNRKLAACISKSLTLEELRANIFAGAIVSQLRETLRANHVTIPHIGYSLLAPASALDSRTALTDMC